jgi:hypothetical protein
MSRELTQKNPGRLRQAHASREAVAFRGCFMRSGEETQSNGTAKPTSGLKATVKKTSTIAAYLEVSRDETGIRARIYSGRQVA